MILRDQKQKIFVSKITPKKILGFTLLETLISVVIVMLLAAAGFAVFYSFKKNSELSVWSNNLLEVTNIAKQRTMQSEGASSYGIHFNEDSFVMFSGLSFDAASASNQIYILPETLEIADISLVSATPDVVFSRITGRVENYGTVVIRQKSDNTLNMVVHIDPSGNVGLGTIELPPDSSRVTDSRHVQFTYDQNVSTATTMTLYFPDSTPVSAPIAFQTYFSGGEFSWSGTVNVNGSSQVLKIMTHGVGLTTATFSVHRDRRYNNKPLQINLDGQNLINYTAAGVETKGSSIWVQSPVRQ
jgi:type II secretory pathway pseudopilin PulG